MPGLQALPLARLPVWKIRIPAPELTGAGFSPPLSSLKYHAGLTPDLPSRLEHTIIRKGRSPMKKFFSLLLTLSLALFLTACGGSTDTGGTAADDTADDTTAEPVELYVFAAASLEESLNEVIDLYKEAAPEVTVVATYDSSGTPQDPDPGGGRLRRIHLRRAQADEPAGRRGRRGEHRGPGTWWTTPPGWTCWRTR